MRQWGAYFVIACVLAGCATTPTIGSTPYRPNVGGDGYGYSEMQLNASTIQVTFVGATGSDAHEGAMFRAAELAMSTGADGFIVTARDDSYDQIVKKRFVVGRVRRNLPATTLTIFLLMRQDFARVYPAMVYDARLIASAAPPR